MRRQWDWDRLPWILVVTGPLLLFGPMLLKGEVLFWGTPLLQFMPWRTYAFSVIQQGYLPLWNPFLGMGAPLIANYQTALFYPPNFLLALIGPARGHGLLVALHLIWAGFGAIVLVRRLRFSPLSQTVAGLAFGLSGYLVARAGFLSINATAAWLPWILAAVDRLADKSRSQAVNRETLKATLLLSLSLAFQWLAGHAQTAWYSLILLIAWVVWRGVTAGDAKHRIRLIVLLVAAGTLAFTLSAVQVVPTLEYLAQSHRAETLDVEFALTYSFWPWRTLGLLMPDLFGNPSRGNYWGYGNYWEDAIYIGVLPFLLSILAMWRGVRGKDPHHSLVRFLMAVAGVAFVFALGKNSHVFKFLYRYVPTFNLFQAPARWNLLLVFALSLLASLGVEYWRRPEGKGLYWTRLGTVGAAIIGAAAWIGARLLVDVEMSFVSAFALAGVWFVASGFLTLRRPQLESPWWDSVVGIVILIDLCIAGMGLNPSVPHTLYEGGSNLVSDVGRQHRVYMDAETEYALKFEQTHRFDTFLLPIDWRSVRDMGLPNTTLLDRIPSANNFDPILPDRYVRWMERLERLPISQQGNMFSLMDVAWHADVHTSIENGIRYVHLPAAERVRLVSKSVVAENAEEAMEMVFDLDFDLAQEVILEGISIQVSEEGKVQGHFELLHSTNPNEVLVEVNSISGVWLVLSDTWYPGWEACVDGERTQIYRANYLFRAVWVPAGEHLVKFYYSPPSFWLGATVSLFGWVAFVLVGWRWARG